MFLDIVFFLVTGTCLYTDIAKRKIYNFILLPAVILAACYHLYAGGLPAVFFSMEGLFLGLALLLIPYLMGGIGAGDVKFLAAIGALKGPSFVFATFLAGAVAGGILAVFYLIKNRKLLFTAKKLLLLFLNRYAPFQNCPAVPEDEPGSTLPYGAAIAIGTLVAYFVR